MTGAGVHTVQPADVCKLALSLLTYISTKSADHMQ
jgi:hypothetical protein